MLKFYMSQTQLKSNVTASIGPPWYVIVVIIFLIQKKEDFWEMRLNAFWKDAIFWMQLISMHQMGTM